MDELNKMKKWFFFYQIIYLFITYYLMPHFELFITLVLIYSFISFGLAIVTTNILDCARNINQNYFLAFVSKLFSILVIIITVLFFIFLQTIIVDLVELNIFLGHPLP